MRHLKKSQLLVGVLSLVTLVTAGSALALTTDELASSFSADPRDFERVVSGTQSVTITYKDGRTENVTDESYRKILLDRLNRFRAFLDRPTSDTFNALLPEEKMEVTIAGSSWSPFQYFTSSGFSAQLAQYSALVDRTSYLREISTIAESYRSNLSPKDQEYVLASTIWIAAGHLETPTDRMNFARLLQQFSGRMSSDSQRAVLCGIFNDTSDENSTEKVARELNVESIPDFTCTENGEEPFHLRSRIEQMRRKASQSEGATKLKQSNQVDKRRIPNGQPERTPPDRSSSSLTHSLNFPGCTTRDVSAALNPLHEYFDQSRGPRSAKLHYGEGTCWLEIEITRSRSGQFIARSPSLRNLRLSTPRHDSLLSLMNFLAQPQT